MEPRSLARQRGTDRSIAELAHRQHGVVARAQLLELGIGPGAIAMRLRCGRLHRVHAGVYLVGHRAAPRWAPEMAALLACGRGAVLSHASALALWGLVEASGALHVSLPRAWRPERPGIVVHSALTLEDRDVARREGMPVTRPARSLVDFASIASLPRLEAVTGMAIAKGAVSRAQLGDQLERRPGERGVGRMRAVLELEGGPAFTRSRPERVLLELIRGARLPVPRTNFFDGRYELDLFWRDQRLVVEVDSFAFHGDAAAFERDRLRDADLNAQGYRVMRVTERQIRNDPNGVLERLRGALACAARRSTAARTPPEPRSLR